MSSVEIIIHIVIVFTIIIIFNYFNVLLVGIAIIDNYMLLLFF